MTNRKDTKNARRAFLIGLIFFGLALRLYKINFHDYVYDEVFTIFASRPSIGDIFFSLPDVHPPLSYILFHLWLKFFGENIITLRLVSVLIGTACVPAIYLLGCKMANSTVALVAAALLSVAPAHIFHSQQARMYPLLTLIVILATLFFWCAWHEGGWLNWFWFCLCVTAGCYTHVYFPFSMAALNVWAIIESYRQRYMDRQRWAKLIGTQLVAACAFLPFLSRILSGVKIFVLQSWVYPNTLFDWISTLVEYTNGITVTFRLETVLLSNSLSFVLGSFSFALGIIIALGTLVYSVQKASHIPIERILLFHCLIWVPIVIATVISLTIQPILINRSLIGILPPLCILMAWMSVQFWRLYVVKWFALFFVVSIGISLNNLYPDSSIPNKRIVMINDLIKEQRMRSAIAFTHWNFFYTMALIHPEQRDFYVLPSPTYDSSFWEQQLNYMHLDASHHIKILSDLAAHYRYIWLEVTIHDSTFAYHQEVSQRWLEQHGHMIKTLNLDDETFMMLYELVPP